MAIRSVLPSKHKKEKTEQPDVDQSELKGADSEMSPEDKENAVSASTQPRPEQQKTESAIADTRIFFSCSVL